MYILCPIYNLVGTSTRAKEDKTGEEGIKRVRKG